MQFDYRSHNTPITQIEYALLCTSLHPSAHHHSNPKLRPYHITQRRPVVKTPSRGATHLHLLVGLENCSRWAGYRTNHTLFKLDPAVAVVNFALACVLPHFSIQDVTRRTYHDDGITHRFDLLINAIPHVPIFLHRY
jgi:hypothetical protein